MDKNGALDCDAALDAVDGEPIVVSRGGPTAAAHPLVAAEVAGGEAALLDLLWLNVIVHVEHVAARGEGLAVHGGHLGRDVALGAARPAALVEVAREAAEGNG